MIDPADWYTWKAKYLVRFLGPDENADFVNEWKPEILKRELADMLAAISDLALDARFEATKPRLHLRLLLEFADIRADKRRPGWKDPLTDQAAPRSSEWNRWMLARGVITKKEFEKREKAGAK